MIAISEVDKWSRNRNSKETVSDSTAPGADDDRTGIFS